MHPPIDSSRSPQYVKRLHDYPLPFLVFAHGLGCGFAPGALVCLLSLFCR